MIAGTDHAHTHTHTHIHTHTHTHTPEVVSSWACAEAASSTTVSSARQVVMGGGGAAMIPPEWCKRTSTVLQWRERKGTALIVT